MRVETQRLQAMQSLTIPVVADLVRRHPGTISLGQGVVHYGPPPQAIEQIAAFLREPQNNKYGPIDGIPPLIAAIADKLRSDNGIEVEGRSRIVVTAGANMGFLQTVLAIADVGDEIVLLTPYYFNHHMAVALAGCRAVLVPTDANYQPQVAAIEAALTPRTRAVLTVSPNNPTGAVYSEAALRAINDLCRRRGVYHISDEPYEYFIYDDARHFSPGAIAGAARHTISLFSLSKAFGFASWRIGYMVVPDGLFEAVKKVQDTNLICPPVVSQFAALGALQAGADYCRERIAGLAGVRDELLRALAPLGAVCQIPPADGAFYLFLKLRTARKDMELVERLVREHGVAVLPGSAFGMTEGCYLRVAYGALDAETVAEGTRRLVRGLSALLLEG